MSKLSSFSIGVFFGCGKLKLETFLQRSRDHKQEEAGVSHELVLFATMVLKIFVALKATHFVGDFAWQSAWMAIEKDKSWLALTAHSATYTSAFVILSLASPVRVSLLGLAIYFLSHMVIDAFKARWKLIGSIWFDQVCHAAVHLILILAGLVSVSREIF